MICPIPSPADDSLRAFVRGALAEHELGERAGDGMGAYTLRERLGEGGFGTVWRATQEQPVRRTVAVKVLKPGMDSAEILARFTQERQALAVMEHPGIARVLDGGATPAGRPFFVMELVSGSPITKFCDEERLSTRERLELMVEVSRAVQHAHQKGIIHRDLKPSNILVAKQDGRAVPKVIDFGIAKAICEERLTEETIRTQQGGLIGTPAYMSPEQLAGSGVADTRTDIYSLGVVLYELLTGQTPIAPEELRAAWLKAGCQRFWETPLPKPSTQVKTLPPEILHGRAAARRLTPPVFVRCLRGDLDCIALKALEREAERRYQTANALAEDLARYLSAQPILARPPSRGYWLRQFVRRNRLAVAAAAAVVVLLVLGLIVSLTLFFRAREALAAAKLEAEKRREVARFLTDTLAAAGVSKTLGRDATMLREVLDQTSERIARELAHRPEVEAELRTTLGRTYEDLDEYPRALEHLQRALELRRALYAGRDDAVLAAAIHDYACALEKMGRYKETEPVVREAIGMFERTLGREHPETGEAHSLLAWVLLKTGRAAQGEDSARLAMKLWERDPRDDRLIEAPKTLACVLRHTKRGAEAEAVFRRELEVLRQTRGPVHPNIVLCLDNIGMQLTENGKFDEAEIMLRESIAEGRKLHGDRNPSEDHALARLATIAGRRGNLEEQIKLAREGVAVAGRVYPEGHTYRREAQAVLSGVLAEQAGIFLERAAQGEASRNLAGARARVEELETLDAKRAAPLRERLAQLKE